MDYLKKIPRGINYYGNSDIILSLVNQSQTWSWRADKPQLYLHQYYTNSVDNINGV